MEFRALISQEYGRWRGYVPDLNLRVSGKDEQEVISRLEVASGEQAAHLLAQGNLLPTPQAISKEDLSEDEFPTHGEWKFHWITPRTPNPVSVAIKQAIKRSGQTASEIARQMQTSPAAITRMTDPSYEGHSLPGLRKLAQVLKLPLQRFVALKQPSLDEFVSVGHPGMHAPGHVTLKRSPELARLKLPALVQWQGQLFWLDAPAIPPYALSDEHYLRFEGAGVNNQGFSIGILT